MLNSPVFKQNCDEQDEVAVDCSIQSPDDFILKQCKNINSNSTFALSS